MNARFGDTVFVRLSLHKTERACDVIWQGYEPVKYNEDGCLALNFSGRMLEEKWPDLKDM